MKRVDYCDSTIKNHKKYGRKIVFVIFKECYIDDPAKLDKVVVEYHRIIAENKGISSVIDTRNVQGCKKTMAFSEARSMRQYEGIVRENLLCLSIIMDNLLLESLLGAVSSVNPFVIATKVTKNNKGALDFLIENFNKDKK